MKGTKEKLPEEDEDSGAGNRLPTGLWVYNPTLYIYLIGCHSWQEVICLYWEKSCDEDAH